MASKVRVVLHTILLFRIDRRLHTQKGRRLRYVNLIERCLFGPTTAYVCSHRPRVQVPASVYHSH